MNERPLIPPPKRSGLSQGRFRLWLATLLLLLFLAYLWRSIFIPIGPGQLGVLWSRFGGGTVKNHVYAEGYKAIWPWNRMAVYDVRLQEMHDVIPVLTTDGLQISVGVTARFRPIAADLTTLHEVVGPRYKGIVVWPDVVAAVRHVIRQLKPEQLRVIGESDLAAKVDAAARDAVQKHWVHLDRVLITQITLPEKLRAAIEEKLGQEQKAISYQYILQQAEQERQKRLIEADGIREFEERSHISFLKWRGVEATEHLAESPNSKIVIMGAGTNQLPVLLSDDAKAPSASAAPAAKPVEPAPQGPASH